MTLTVMLTTSKLKNWKGLFLNRYLLGEIKKLILFFAGKNRKDPPWRLEHSK
jgi:hypothetical protein